jgi:hypothetical protein
VNKKQKVASSGNNDRNMSVSVEEWEVLSVPEEEDLPSTPENEKDAIKQKFLVEMPEDFYSFWSFCKSLSPDKPEGM